MRLLSKVLWVLWYRGLRYLIIAILMPYALASAYLDEPLSRLVYYTSRVTTTLFRAVAKVTYLLGVLATGGLLISSLLLFIYIFCMEIGLSMPKLQGYYEIATRIFSHQSSWAAVTTIVGTTVALSHLKNLGINRERYFAEMRDRRKAEEEERQKRLNTFRSATRAL